MNIVAKLYNLFHFYKSAPRNRKKATAPPDFTDLTDTTGPSEDSDLMGRSDSSEGSDLSELSERSAKSVALHA